MTGAEQQFDLGMAWATDDSHAALITELQLSEIQIVGSLARYFDRTELHFESRPTGDGAEVQDGVGLHLEHRAVIEA